jgi:hypothetical protein
LGYAEKGVWRCPKTVTATNRSRKSSNEWTPVEEALGKAFYGAVLLHRQANVAMTFCDKDGKPYGRDAHEIPIREKYADLEPFRY